MKRQWVIIVENLEIHEEEHWQVLLSEDRNKASDEALKLVKQESKESGIKYRLVNIIDPSQ